jgi:hypothetical protein
MKTSSKGKTHFVPEVVFRTAFAGVVPICVAGLACGGSSGGGTGDGSVSPSVACAGFACMGVGVQAFADGGDGPLLSVACIGFDGQPCGSPADGAAQDSSKAADANDGSCFCCTNFCGVGVMAFSDGGDSG